MTKRPPRLQARGAFLGKAEGSAVLYLNDERPLDDAALAAPALSRPDIVEEWGKQSFPASDPPSNW